MSTSETEKPKKGKLQSYFRRHFLFFAMIVIFAYVIQARREELKDFLSIRISKKNTASNRKANQVFDELLAVLGENKVDRSSETLQQYNKDKSHHPSGNPDIIVFAESTEDVVEAMKICYKRNMIVIPMGFNSGLEGQTIAYQGGVLINMMRMKKIVKLYEDDMQVTVEPGLRISEVSEYTRQYGYFFPVEPGSNPSVGGAVSTRASGTLTPSYQTMKENTISLEVVLPNGDVITTKKRSIKSSAGYDLTSLFIGSEGTLGVITKITLKMSKVPNSISSSVVTFTTLKEAANTCIEVKQKGIPGVARMEIINPDGIKAVNDLFGTKLVLKPSLLFEFHGSTDKDVSEVAEVVGEICKKNGGSDYKFTVDEEERKELWKARNGAYFASSKVRKDCKTCRLYSTDICVPISQFADVISESEKDFQNAGFPLTPIVGHSGDGNFHILIPVDWANEDEVRKLHECNERLVERSINHDGTSTGEHGIGIGKKSALRKELGDVAVDLMKKIKLSVDPKNMMNPNKIF